MAVVEGGGSGGAGTSGEPDTLILPGGVLAGDEEDEEETEPQDPEEDVIINPIPFKSCKWLLLRRNGNLFLALVSWDPNPQTVALDFNYTTLGVSAPGGTRQWVDLDTSTALTPDANSDITVDMAGVGMF